MGYEIRHKVRFGDIDGAGIVFYPRYFEMLNASVEDWFENKLGVSFTELHMHRGLGCPTVALDCAFVAPSQLGEQLTISVAPVELGRASCKVAYVVSCDGQERMRASAVLVCMDLKAHKAAPWPEDLVKGIRADLPAGAA